MKENVSYWFIFKVNNEIQHLINIFISFKTPFDSLGLFWSWLTLIMVIISYTYIALTILKIPSTSQRKKAFSTCSSHMIVISLSYGSCIFMYVKPSVKQRVSFSKGISVLNTSVAPLLNPFIYTLRNQQVKKAFMNLIYRAISFSK